MSPRLARFAAAAAMLAAAPLAAQSAALPPLPQFLSPRAVTAMPSATPAKVFHYGDHPAQIVELYLPPTRRDGSLLPVAVLIHGGCFNSKLGGAVWMRPAATALARQGYAVWSIGYREADQEGGGYPGTYQDVAHAIDLLQGQLGEYQLDPGRIIVFGHSAGGQMALWAAGRKNIPASSPLYTAKPLTPRGVVAVGAYGTLQSHASDVASRCGAAIMEKMLPASGSEAEKYAAISPDRLLPTGVPTVLLHGVFDSFASPAIGLSYVEAARKAQDRSEIEVAPVANHFEGIAPGTPMFRQVTDAIQRLLQ